MRQAGQQPVRQVARGCKPSSALRRYTQQGRPCRLANCFAAPAPLARMLLKKETHDLSQHLSHRSPYIFSLLRIFHGFKASALACSSCRLSPVFTALWTRHASHPCLQSTYLPYTCLCSPVTESTVRTACNGNDWRRRPRRPAAPDVAGAHDAGGRAFEPEPLTTHQHTPHKSTSAARDTRTTPPAAAYAQAHCP